MSNNKENYNIFPLISLTSLKPQKRKEKNAGEPGWKKKIRHNRRSVERRKRNPKRIADVPG